MSVLRACDPSGRVSPGRTSRDPSAGAELWPHLANPSEVVVHVRLAFVPVIALAAIAVPAASAAPKPVKLKPTCNVITDAKGDTFAARSQNNPPAGNPVF